MMCLGGVAFAVQAPNPRDTTTKGIVRSSDVAANQSRRASTGTRVRSIQPGRSGAVISRVVRPDSTRMVRTGASTTRTAVRSASPTVARSATKTSRSGISGVGGLSALARSTGNRATAVFSDVSKIGSGYATCRESYSTCMDQMCANANDTYRRCFCSERFTKFRDAEEKLDQAMIMLQQFQDNNLNAVDKSAAEVNAMYTATVGEMAIKRDTSAAGQMLDNITELLSGKSNSGNKSSSLGILDLDFSTNFDDIWSSDISSIFDSTTKDISSLEGVDLFNAAQKQCLQLSRNMCENDAVFNMTQSSYNILIAQDCNAYEKSLNKKKETVAAAVREAEKYLREARLEEYRTHNSADVNQCLDKVRTAIFADTACGENYKRCLDPTGAYIDTNGEPIYTPRLFQLEKQITLTGDMSKDILASNRQYDNFLEPYRKYVVRELDTCRDIADFVWTEFKRVAVMEIAQVQAEKLEEVRMSCVDTIAECYDSQSKSLANMDKDTAVTAGALGRYTAKGMCREKVLTCAALYTPVGGQACKINSNGKISNGEECGFQGLIDFVNRVDELSVVNRCEKAVEEHLTKLCTPDQSGQKYPYNCRYMEHANLTGGVYSGGLYDNISSFVDANCKFGSDTTTDLEDQLTTIKENAYKDVSESIMALLADKCEESDGVWYDRGVTTVPSNPERVLPFYQSVFGGNTNETEWGNCYRNTEQMICLSYNDGAADDEEIATWDAVRGICTFKTAWYERQCELLGNGYFEDGVCYIEQ